MRRISILATILLLVTAGCTSFHSSMVRHFAGDNPYAEDPFWVRYLIPGQPVDREIRATLDALKADPWSAPLHNRLGELLSKKALPKWAEVEFDRAIASDKRFYPAWYNLGLMREYRGNDSGAINAFKTTLDYKPGHAAAHFQLALLYERRGSIAAAVDHYATAIRINPQLLDVEVNPRVVDSRLLDRAILKLYPSQHSRESLRFEPTPPSYPEHPSVTPASMEPTPAAQPAPSQQPAKPAQPIPPQQSNASASGAVTTQVPVTATAPSALPKPEKIEDMNPFWQRRMKEREKAREAEKEATSSESETSAQTDEQSSEQSATTEAPAEQPKKQSRRPQWNRKKGKPPATPTDQDSKSEAAPAQQEPNPPADTTTPKDPNDPHTSAARR